MSVAQSSASFIPASSNILPLYWDKFTLSLPPTTLVYTFCEELSEAGYFHVF